MTPHLKAEVMKFDQYKAQFNLLRKHNITTPEELDDFSKNCEKRIAEQMKTRTIFNVKKKKRKKLYDALSDITALQPAVKLYAEGMTGIENEVERYMEAMGILERTNTSIDALTKEKAETYQALADINREIRELRSDVSLCNDIVKTLRKWKKTYKQLNPRKKER